MKKDNALLIMKPLIIAVLLMLCQTAIGQHPLLSGDELDLYISPTQSRLVRLGKSASDEGRTCYKWHGYFEEGLADRLGSYQAFLLPDYMAVPGTSYTYVLTVIGEQYYQQEVVLHVINDITFEVHATRGCISGNEMPQIEDFEITTNPPGFENLVHLAAMHPHTQNVIDGHYDVTFELRDNNIVLDQHTVEIINTDDDAMNSVYNVPVDKILKWRSNMVEVIDAIEKGLKWVPGWYGDVGVDLPEPDFGTWTISRGYDCCDEMKNQIRTDVDFLGVKAGLHVDGGFNFVLGKAFLRGQVEVGLGLSNVHVKVFETCAVDPPTINFDLSSTVSVGAYVEDFTGGKLLSAYARFAWEIKKSFIKLDFVGSDYVSANGSISTSVYFEASVTVISLFEKSCTVPIVPEKTFYVNTPIKLN